MAQAEPDIEAPADTPICDSANFKNQGQWIQCLRAGGLRGRELARAIHDEHRARKGGGEPTAKSIREAKRRAREAEKKHRKHRGQTR